MKFLCICVLYFSLISCKSTLCNIYVDNGKYVEDQLTLEENGNYERVIRLQGLNADTNRGAFLVHRNVLHLMPAQGTVIERNQHNPGHVTINVVDFVNGSAIEFASYKLKTRNIQGVSDINGLINLPCLEYTDTIIVSKIGCYDVKFAIPAKTISYTVYLSRWPVNQILEQAFKIRKNALYEVGNKRNRLFCSPLK